MMYLFGDSTRSPLKVNFIDFLRDGLDFCVDVMLSADALKKELERGDVLRHTARHDIEELEKLSTDVASAIKATFTVEGDGPVARCARAVLQSTSDLVRSEINAVSSALKKVEAKLEAAQADQRDHCFNALETLLTRHDLSNSTTGLHLKARGDLYDGELRATTSLGVAATFTLDVPSTHLFGHVFRVDRLVDRLEIQVPDVGGWLSKERKLRPQRLEKLYVIEVDLGGKESTIKLRAEDDGTGPGFDIAFREEAPRVRVARVAERDASPEPAFDAGEADAESLLDLLRKLEPSAQELSAHRKTLLEARLDDRALREHDAPTLLVERFVHAVAPVVREIAQRSPSSGELVIKRALGNGRREEIFVAKSELREKLERVPAELRPMFESLGLSDERPPAAIATSRPPPLPPRSSLRRSNDPLIAARRALATEAPAVEPLGALKQGADVDYIDLAEHIRDSEVETPTD